MVQTDHTERQRRIEQAIEQVYATRQIDPGVSGRLPYRLVHNVNPDEGRMLRDLVAQVRPRRTLEIGMGTGLSGLHLCWGLLRAAPAPGTNSGAALGNGAADAPLGRHTAIDPFQKGEFWQGIGLALRDQAGATDMFEWIGERDDVVLPRMLAAGEKIEFALIDGDHRFEAAMLDFYYIDKLLPVGGMCVIDDTDWPSVWRVVQFALRHRNYEWVDAVPIDQGPLTRPWGWKLRFRRWGTFRRQGWPLREALRRKPYQFVALRKTAEDHRPEHFWKNLE
jgi:hypothetical protein